MDRHRTHWESTDILKTPMEICWQFNYTIEIEQLRKLYSKSKRLQWDAERDVDWQREIDPSRPILDEDRFGYHNIPFMQRLSKSQREAFTAHASAHRLSQFLHGEQGALMTAAALTHAVPDYEAKLYAATQTMDEARHVEVFERYVSKLAEIYPISPMLKSLIDATLTADHWVKIAIGMNMVVEGLALGAFHNMRRATNCELMREIVEQVLRDEARHVAFGNVYVGATLSDMHEDDREDVAQFAFEMIKMMVQSSGGPEGRGRPAPDPGFRQALERSGIDPADFVRGVKEAREQGVRMDLPPGSIHSFKDLMMPALVRVGAVTERTRELYRAEEIPVYDDTSVLESMEDAETGTVAEAAN
ncbi:MAG: ferritin-like domain-containing protein [Myxococcota bacterium]